MPRPTLDNVLSVHAQEASDLYAARCAMVRLPHITLATLSRHDERLNAHLDGLATGGDQTWPLLDDALDQPTGGDVFVLAVLSIEAGQPQRLERLWSLAQRSLVFHAALSGAFGWVEPVDLPGPVQDLLRSEDSTRIIVGLDACVQHGRDPGLEAGPWLRHQQPQVRAQALKAVGELGLRGLSSYCIEAMSDDDPECRFWAACSAVLLGNHEPALAVLRTLALTAGEPHREHALSLALQAMDTESGHALLQALNSEPANLRWLVRSAGIVGDVMYVPWLIALMTQPETARAAGEAFTLITGAGLDGLQLWRQQPEHAEIGLADDLSDDNVELDADEGLMWPDQKRVDAWWAFNSKHFHAGRRYFLGAQVSRQHCIDVIRRGYQGQRLLAALHIHRLVQGLPLFDPNAPAKRQLSRIAALAQS